MSAASGRYSRQVLQWGTEKQEIIESSTLLVAGIGGLGATVSQLLVRAGIGCLYLVEDGVVEWPDLNRQTLYYENDVGRKKLDVAIERLAQINSATRLIPVIGRIEPSFVISDGVDCIVDCLDNFSGRSELYRAAPHDRYFIHGGVHGEFGQVVTFAKGQSQAFDAVFAGCRQPSGVIPVTPDSVVTVAGIICKEIFSCLFGTPKLLDRMLVLSLTDFHISFLDL